MSLKSLPGIFDFGMPRLFDIEPFLFDHMIPCDRKALLPKRARAARISAPGDMRSAPETILLKGDRLVGTLGHGLSTKPLYDERAAF